jgi:predicted PurR-regulated permease PerM
VDEALDMVGQGLSYAGLIGQTMFVLIAVMLLAYYWTQDGERTLRFLLRVVPSERRENARQLIADMEEKVGAFIRGQTILCAAVGGVSFVAYALIGLPYALLLALIAGVLEVVPIVGPMVSIIPAAMLALSLAPAKLLWVIVAAFVIQQLEGNLLVPRVMNKAVGVNGLVTILSLVGFTSLLGLPGALLAIPIAAIIQLLLDRFVLGPAAIEPEAPDGRDYLSKLRYEAQELVRDVRRQIRNKEEETTDHTDAVEDEIEAIATDLDSILARAEVQEEEA